jgi:predicted permease
MTSLWSNLAALWSLFLLVAVIATLLWFFYWFFLRRIIRVRRMANARLRRMMREAGERESGGD